MSTAPVKIAFTADTEEFRRRVLCAYISSYWLANWTSPTVREIRDAAGLKSTETAHRLLASLVEDGRLEVKRLSSHRVLYRVPR